MGAVGNHQIKALIHRIGQVGHGVGGEIHHIHGPLGELPQQLLPPGDADQWPIPNFPVKIKIFIPKSSIGASPI